MSPFWILLEDDGGGGDNWSYDICKAALKLSLPTNQHPVLFIGQMSFLSPNQQCQSTEGKHCDRLDEGNCSQGSQCQTVRVEPRGGRRLLGPIVWPGVTKFGLVTYLGRFISSTVPKKSQGSGQIGTNSLCYINAHWHHVKQNSQVCQHNWWWREEVVCTGSKLDTSDDLEWPLNGLKVILSSIDAQFWLCR